MTHKKPPPVKPKAKKAPLKKKPSPRKAREKKTIPKTIEVSVSPSLTIKLDGGAMDKIVSKIAESTRVPTHMLKGEPRKPIVINMGGGRTLSRGMLRSMEDRINGGWGVAELVEGKFQFVDGERFERQDDANTYLEVVEEMRA